MRRFVFVLSLALLFATAAFARPIQTPPPAPPPQTTPTPTPAPPVTATVTTGRSGTMAGAVVVERQSVEQRAAAARGQGEPITITKLIGSSGPTSWQNVKLDVKISDSITLDAQHGKTITVLCLDGNSSQVRSQSGEGLINIDARPMIRPDGRIYVQLILEYRPDLPNETGAPANAPYRTGAFSESLNLLVTDAKPMVASQTADPRSDRKVTIELTATVVK